ncbi:MAG: tetratricopeptide repeat protein [Chloroflexi bacterium]|nr:tetratricopeptide repeat protein [Chloroflexota bacterium]
MRRPSFPVVVLAAIIVIVLLALASPLPFLMLGDRDLAEAQTAAAEEQYDRAVTLALLPPLKADALWGRARARLVLLRYDEAASDSTAVLELRPEQTAAYLCRAQARAKLGAHEPAATDFSAFLATFPDDAAALFGRANAYAILQRHADAAADLTRYLVLHPGAADALALRARSYSALAEWQNAVTDYAATLETGQDTANMLAGRGYAYLQLGQLDEAVVDLSKAVEQKADGAERNRTALADALYRRAQNEVEAGALPKALADLNDAIFADATRADIHTLRAFAALELERYADTVTAATQAIELAADSTAAYAYRAYALAQRGELELARADALRVIDTAQSPPRERALAFYARAIVAEAQGRDKAAIGDASDALALGVLSPRREMTLYVLRASARLQLETYSEAIADFDRAEQREPTDALKRVIFAGRGYAFLQQDSFVRAGDEFSAALRLGPEDAWLYQQRGMAYAGRRKYDLALEDYNRSIELDGRQAAFYVNRGIVHAAQKEYEAALADFDKALANSNDETLSNWTRSYILLTRSAVHSQKADEASRELKDLLGKVDEGDRAQWAKRFQSSFSGMRDRVRTIQEQVGLMAEQFGAMEKLDLPDWYLVFASKSRESLELQVEGFAAFEQLWTRTNTLVTALPKLVDTLDNAAKSSALSRAAFQKYEAYLDRFDYTGARQLTASMRQELEGFRDTMQKIQRESGLTFVADAVDLFDKQLEYTRALDRLTDAQQAGDYRRFLGVLSELDKLETQISAASKRMSAWGDEFDRWEQRNLTPLVDKAKQKFEAAKALSEEAAKIFDEGRSRITVKQPRRLFPPPGRT